MKHENCKSITGLSRKAIEMATQRVLRENPRSSGAYLPRSKRVLAPVTQTSENNLWSRANYAPTLVVVRQGADDHLKWKSKGLGC